MPGFIMGVAGGTPTPPRAIYVLKSASVANISVLSVRLTVWQSYLEFTKNNVAPAGQEICRKRSCQPKIHDGCPRYLKISQRDNLISLFCYQEIQKICLRMDNLIEFH